MIHLGLALIVLGICGEGALNMYEMVMGEKPFPDGFKTHLMAMGGMVISGIIGVLGWLCIGAEGLSLITS